MKPRRYRIIAARRLHDGTAALWRTSTVRQKAATIAGTAITVLKIAPQQHGIIAVAAGAWAVAAWRASAPSDAPTRETTSEPLTSEGNISERAITEPGEGMSIIKTTAGTARSIPHPDQPNRTIIEWDKP